MFCDPPVSGATSVTVDPIPLPCTHFRSASVSASVSVTSTGMPPWCQVG